MISYIKRAGVIIVFSVLGLSCTQEAKLNPGEFLREKSPGVEQVGEGLFRIGQVLVDATNMTVTFPAEVNMQEGLVEYLICARWGKLHESVLATEANPLDIQLGLLALGMTCGGGVEFQGDRTKGKGDALRIFVEWDEGGSATKVRAEELVFDRKRDKPMKRSNWIFTGSVIIEGHFMAQFDGLIAATYNDPCAIINSPLPSRYDDEILFANSAVAPPAGTSVTVILERVKK